MVEWCKFCELLVKQLREGTGFFEGYPKEVRDEILGSMNSDSPVRDTKDFDELGPLMLVRAHCRSVGLCSKHADTIKRDNKVRAKKGIDIPIDLSIISKLRLYDW